LEAVLYTVENDSAVTTDVVESKTVELDFGPTFSTRSRVATHLENLEKSGNLKVVREKSGKMEKVRGD